MKKKLLCVLAILGSVTFSVAQSSSGFDFGIKGGVNIAGLSGDNFEDAQKELISFHGGLVGELHMSYYFSLQTELTYSAQGIQVVDDEGPDLDYKMNYLQLPVMAKFYFVEDYSSIEIGPQFSYKFNESVDTYEEDKLRDFDFGIVAGLTYKFDNGVFVSGRYYHGLDDLLISTRAFGSGYIRSSVIQFSLGYMF